MKRLGLLAVVVAMLLSGSTAWADDFYVIAGGRGVGTRITSLPYTISTPGFYYLGGNLETSLAGITIDADDVTLDLMGFRLLGPSTESGIVVHGSGRNNVEIRNGTVRGWKYGIYAYPSPGAGYNIRVINVQAEFNEFGFFLTNVNPGLVKGCTANQISDTGIYIYYNGTASDNRVYSCKKVGIQIFHGIISNNLVIYGEQGIRAEGANTVSGNMVNESNTGIFCKGGGSVIGNTVYSGLTVNGPQTGILLSDYSLNPITMDQNTVTGPGTHYAGGGSNVVWAGKSTFYPYGNNAGAP